MRDYDMTAAQSDPLQGKALDYAEWITGEPELVQLADEAIAKAVHAAVEEIRVMVYSYLDTSRALGWSETIGRRDIDAILNSMVGR